MNVKRFTAKSSRDPLNSVRRACGEEAVVLSTKPCAEAVEGLAMGPEGMQQIEQVAQRRPTVRHEAPAARAARPAAQRAAPAAPAAAVDQDVEALAMSTLSFQDYVRERMLKKREAEMLQAAEPA